MPKPIIPQINWNNPLSKGLLFDVPFYEGGSSNSKDIVNYVKGVNTNSPSWVRDVYGNSLKCAVASSQYVDYGSPANLTLNRNFSIMLLFKINSLDASASRALISHSQNGYYLRVNSTGGGSTLQFIKSQVAGIVASITAISPGIWYMGGITVDSLSTANVVIYLNGERENAVTSALTYNGNIKSLKIGAEENNGAGIQEYLDGTIAYTRIWNRVLSDTEVKQLHTNPWQIYTQPILLPTTNIQQAVVGGASLNFRNLLGVGI